MIEKGLILLSEWVEKRPAWGIIASFSGFGTTLLAWLHAGSVLLGFFGAAFGCAAGIYTFLIKRAHWHRIKNHKD